MIIVTGSSGEEFEFQSSSPVSEAWTSRPILAGCTYPTFPFIEDVETVVDVGANCGAASVYFATQHPGAKVYAVEPGSEQLRHLRHNAGHFDNIEVHEVGLSDASRTAELHLSDSDTGQASVYRGSWHGDRTETISLCDASAWARENGIERIDVLKVDVEMSELVVFESLAAFLPETSLVHFEFGSRHHRREIDRLLDPTHELLLAHLSLDHGECTYLRRDLADHPTLKDEIIAVVARREKLRAEYG